MAATAQSGKRGDDLVSGTPFDLGSAQTTKPKTRVPEILLGTFLVAVFALAGAWFYSTSTQRDSYVGLRTSVQRGQEISGADLIRFEVSGDERLVAIEWRDASSIVGKLAVTDMAAGTLVTPGYFTDQADIADGFGIVGLSLETGEYPTAGIRAGDWVRVVAVPRNNDSNAPAEALADRAQIVEVATEGGTGRFVSLTMATATADRVAAVEAEGRVRLIQIPDQTVSTTEDGDAAATGAGADDAGADSAAADGEDG
ncbi:MAG: hypothetical protein AAF531_21550 [Actinomycetota bacterium]